MHDPSQHPELDAIRDVFRRWGWKTDDVPTAEIRDQFSYYHDREPKLRLMVGPRERELLTYAFHWVRSGVWPTRAADDDDARHALERARALLNYNRLPLRPQLSRAVSATLNPPGTRPPVRARKRQWRPPLTEWQIARRKALEAKRAAAVPPSPEARHPMRPELVAQRIGRLEQTEPIYRCKILGEEEAERYFMVQQERTVCSLLTHSGTEAISARDAALYGIRRAHKYPTLRMRTFG
jgi:hypothetical protein